MATPKKPDDGLEGLQSQQSSLSSISEFYEDITKKAGIYTRIVRQNASQSTALNKTIQDSVDLVSKIGKELISQNQIKRVSRDLEGQLKKFTASRDTQLKSMSTIQKKQVEIVEKEYKAQEKLGETLSKISSKELVSEYKLLDIKEKIKNLNDQGITTGPKINSLKVAELKHEQEMQAATTKKALVESKIKISKDATAKLIKDERIGTAVILGQQQKIAQVSKEIFESKKKDFKESNRGFQRHHFFKALTQRLGLGHAHNFAQDKERMGLAGALGLGAIGVGMTALAAIIALMNKASNQITNISRGMTLTREEADKVRDNFFAVASQSSKLADYSSDILVTQTDIYKTQFQLNKLFGTAVVMNAQQLAQMNEMRDIMQLSEEAMKGLLTYSLGSGKEIDNIRNAVLGTTVQMQLQNGIMLDNKQIQEDVYKTTGAIRQNFKGNLTELTKAVTQAKLYGLSLEQVQKTSEGLLDFESSINNQLEAELLTGRSINVERARAAALAGDTNTVMQEITKQLGSQQKFNDLNVLAQESLAKTFGMTRGELSDIFFQQKAIAGLAKTSVRDVNGSLTERYNLLVKQGLTQDELNGKLGKDVALRLEKQSAQERFTKLMERVEDIFSRMFNGDLLEKVAKFLGGVAEHLSSGGSLLGVITNSSGFQESVDKAGQKLHDGLIGPSGNIQISTPRGKIVPDNGDSVITTTNPGALLNGGGNKDVADKLDKLIDIIQKGGNVYMDSRKVGTTQAIAYSAYK